jgi:hypothetical protein
MAYKKFFLVVSSVVFFLIVFAPAQLKSQAMPEVFTEGTLSEQYEYLHQRTNIYNDFRAIREDMFRRIRRNSLDSLNSAYDQINQLNQQIVLHVQQIGNLEAEANQANEERDIAIKERDSLFLFGIPMSKVFYNSLLWSLILGLSVVLVLTAILFRRANAIAREKTNNLRELQTEYDEYRKSSRERFEKQSIDHFNELKRLKGI